MNSFLLSIIKNEHQRQKYQQLEDMASQVTDGRIVELGTYLGYGAIALCTGARDSIAVYTIDDFEQRQGWAGETYSSRDEEFFIHNCNQAKIYPFFIRSDVRIAGKEWPGVPISLLVWDLGIPSRLCEDFEVWERHISGKFVIHDTDDNRLGSDLLNPIGWKKYKDGVFWVLEREELIPDIIA